MDTEDLSALMAKAIRALIEEVEDLETKIENQDVEIQVLKRVSVMLAKKGGVGESEYMGWVEGALDDLGVELEVRVVKGGKEYSREDIEANKHVTKGDDNVH